MFDKSWPFSADPARCLQVAHFNSFSVSRYKGPVRFDEAQVRKNDPSKVLKIRILHTSHVGEERCYQ